MKNKIAPTANIAGILLGLIFIVFGLNFFFKFIPIPSPPEGTPAAAFMGAMYGGGYLAFVKILEILGGALTAIPKTRNFGLLILGPIIVNILAFHAFITKSGLFDPLLVVTCLLAAFLLYSERHRFAKLLG